MNDIPRVEGRLDRVDEDVRKLRHEVANAIQNIWASVAKIERAVGNLEIKDNHQNERLTESHARRDEQFREVRQAIESLRQHVDAQFKVINETMVTRKDNWPNKLMAGSAVIGGIVMLAGLVFGAWTWLLRMTGGAG